MTRSSRFASADRGTGVLRVVAAVDGRRPWSRILRFSSRVTRLLAVTQASHALTWFVEDGRRSGVELERDALLQLVLGIVTLSSVPFGGICGRGQSSIPCLSGGVGWKRGRSDATHNTGLGKALFSSCTRTSSAAARRTPGARACVRMRMRADAEAESSSRRGQAGEENARLHRHTSPTRTDT